MISVLLCSMPAEGHVRPMVSVARELLARGWRVRVLTGAAFEGAVRAAGADFLPLPGEADVLGELEHDPTLRGIASINVGIRQAFFDPAPAASEAVLAALADEPVDAVLHETTFLATVGLEALPAADRPLRVLCGILPLGISSRDTAPFGLGIPPMRGPVGRVRNRLLGWVARRVVLRPVHQQADVVLARLGAAPLGGDFFIDVLRRDDLLAQFTVPEFEYPRSDAPPHLHFLGPVTRGSASGPAAALPDWWSHLDDPRPVVHVSQGTVANADFSELIAPTVEALADLDVTVVVATGGRPLDELPPLPANAFAAEFIPYDLLMARTAVFVTNGGYGGLHFAIEHGVPVVVAGDTEDKVETSARVAWSGIGLSLKTSRPTAVAVRRAVERVLGDPAFARRSAAIGASIRTSPGIDGLAALIEDAIERRRRS